MLIFKYAAMNLWDDNFRHARRSMALGTLLTLNEWRIKSSMAQRKYTKSSKAQNSVSFIFHSHLNECNLITVQNR